ncbi:MAG: Smr/MutS family protein [Bacteroides sp.]|nr:Smr/MutS family protein [Bacteroides sp.]MCM1457152.1 Smr/MutS family protein [Lachnoclostridium sp.]
MIKTTTYPPSIEAKIGFSAVREMVAACCVSPLGRRRVEEMTFSPDFDTVDSRIGAVAEMMAIITSGEAFPLNHVYDLEPQIRSLRAAGSHIGEADALRLRNSLATASDIASFFATHTSDTGTPEFPRLAVTASRIGELHRPVAAIDRIVDRTGIVKDTASPELGRIRSAIASMSGTINSVMRRVMSRAVNEGYLEADASPSVRDGRLVIPVAPMNKRRIPGIVHDESASGKTVFIEPAEVVEVNNRLRQLQLDERREILRILVELADVLRPYMPQMLDAVDTLADFDFIHAKARFAIDTDASVPHIIDGMQLELYRACHPVLQASLRRQGKEIVPLDIRLTPEQRILVISGPNAGGKSVALKTVAIVQYMLQCGLMPSVAENSHFGIVDGIMVDIGDDQSIEDDLSTYSSHLRNLRQFLLRGTDRTIVLIDEFGSGTEPQMGGAIAQAVLEEFNRKGMWGIVTTHFHNLKQFASETLGLVNGSMQYDRQKMRPLFRLSIGSPGSSFALEIARTTGLPDAIVKKAEEIAGSDLVNLDRYLLDIARDRRYWENKRMAIRQKEKKIDDVLTRSETDAEELRRSRREILDDARRQAKEIIEGSNAAVERTIHDIRRAQADREATLEARRRLAQERNALEAATDEQHPLLGKTRKKKKKEPAKPVPAALRPIAVGDNVVLADGSKTVGTVLEISGKKATVAFGAIKTRVDLDRLAHTDRQIPKASKAATFVSATTADSSRERQLNFKQEIDVRGYRADEAVQAVTYYIDDAVQFGAGRVRILHGTGTGALRQYIRQYLSTVPSVESYADEDVRFGGAGITVVNLK